MESQPNDFRSMMERYNRELLRMQQRAGQYSDPPVAEEEADNFQGNVSQEQSAGEYIPPAPTTESEPEPAPAPVPTPAPTSAAAAFTAPLQVRVTSANGAIPIPDALVIVTRQENGETVVETSRITNSSGLTEPVFLSAVDPALTLQPGNNIPRIVHEVTVSAPDHYRARISDIPLYGGIHTELPVSLIPLPEFADDPQQEIRYVTPPINL